MSRANTTPRKQHLMKLVISKEHRIRKLQRICRKRAQDIKSLSDLSDSSVVCSLFAEMPNTMANFLIAQLRCVRRWNTDEKVIAIALYKRATTH